MDQGYVVQSIIGKRLSSKGKIEYLVKWQGYSVKESTWQPIKNLSYVQDIIEEYQEQLKAPPKTQPIHKKRGRPPKSASQRNSESVRSQDGSKNPNPEPQLIDKKPQQPQPKPIQPSRAGFAPPQQSREQSLNFSDGQDEIKVLRMKIVQGRRYFQVALPQEIKWVSNDLMKKLYPGQLIAYYQTFVTIS